MNDRVNILRIAWSEETMYWLTEIEMKFSQNTQNGKDVKIFIYDYMDFLLLNSINKDSAELYLTNSSHLSEWFMTKVGP